MKVLLISTYELGRQPFAVGLAAALIEGRGGEARCLDLSVDTLDDEEVQTADAIALWLPMFTATRIALAALPRIRQLNPEARLGAWGLYAPLNATALREHGVEFLGAAECEHYLAGFLMGQTGSPEEATAVALDRMEFEVPDRAGLPALDRYARLRMPDGTERVVGSTEATRGCKHVCRHCPVVPVYKGRFHVVPADIVMADVDQQVSAGAQHITFGDPDFFNGPGHARAVVEALHARHPGLSYDVTVKVEHLLAQRELLPVLQRTGCTLITSAVEALDERTLSFLDKGHSRADFVTAVELCRDNGLNLQPTFVAFTPWTTLESYADMLRTLGELDLVGNVSPIQLAIRLLIPRGSWLLDVPEVSDLVDDFDEALLGYPWKHPRPEMDALQREIEALVDADARADRHRSQTFEAIWDLASRYARRHAPGDARLHELPPLPARATIPYPSQSRGTAERSPPRSSWLCFESSSRLGVTLLAAPQLTPF